MKAWLNFLVKTFMIAEFVVILITLYCMIGGIQFRSYRLLVADIFLLMMLWLTHEFLNPTILKDDLYTGEK